MENKDKGFCVNCGQHVVYSVTLKRKAHVTIHGKTFDYEKLSAICNECGEEIYVPKINDMNVDSIRSAYEI